MPQLGDNAVMKAVRAIAAVEAHRFEEHPHPLLGAPTLAVTSVHGGENVNSVPDACAFTLDIRTIPGMDHAGVLTRLRACLEPDATLDPPLADLGAVGTDPDHPFVRCVQEIVARHAGKRAATPAGMPYFTDGSILQPAYQQCPTVVIGPGEPGQAHQMDEFCAVGSIVRAAAIYRDVIEAWCEA
jgi:succinyl-diaminopimelate desuccinylase